MQGKTYAIDRMPEVDENGDVVLRSHEFLWLDLETTGLTNDKPGGLFSDGRVLEVAVALAADDRDGDFAIVQSWDFAVQYPEPHTLEAYVRNMHAKSSLLDDCAASIYSQSDADELLCLICDQQIGPTKGGYVLAGNSVHFDLAWARRCLPRFASRLSHRVFDISTLTRAADAWGIGVHPPPVKAHRALDDVRESLAIAKAWRDAVRTAA